MKNNKILIIAAHPDDEILGCGGTISKLNKDNKINFIFMTMVFLQEAIIRKN